jgi:hypothetical protein
MAPFRFDRQWNLLDGERASINCISWLGGPFASLTDGGVVGDDEEQELSSDIPFQKGVRNVIFGAFCVVHFAFGPQRQHLDELNYLSLYESITTVRDINCGTPLTGDP